MLMRGRRRFRAAAAIVSLLLGACAGAPVATNEFGAGRNVQSDSAIDALRRALAHAILQVSRGELADADGMLRGVIRSTAFDQLGSEEQHDALYIAGLVAIDLGRYAEAHPLLVRSSVLPEATDDDWFSRLDAARAAGAEEDAIQSLTQLARRFPTSLEGINDQVVWETVERARHSSNGKAALHDLIDSLYSAQWKLAYGLEPSGLWRDLVALELERGQFERAQEVVGRVTSPQVLIGMRVDRRFDVLRETIPEHFDIDAAIAKDLAMMQDVVQSSPRSLDAVVQFTYSMLTARRYEDLLRTTAEVLRKVQVASPDQSPYDDLDAVIWIHDNRSRALAALGRWSEAEAEVRRAAYMKEKGQTNVSNVINLAWFYAEAGRSDEALASFADLGEDMSPYGLMQMHGARYAAALHKGDLAIANESFSYIEKNRRDALDMWQWTLVRANRLDEAAALLIERLQDPVLRGRALEDLQEYQDPPPTAARAVWNVRWMQIKNRADVRRAVDAVGRIERFSVAREVS